MRSWIPNGLTALNLVFGVFSILYTFHGELRLAAILIVAAMVADGMDGRVARYMKISGDFGKELDSLCDLVSFGVAPAFLGYVFFLHNFGGMGMLAGAVFATCGAMRLARFNVNTTTVKGYFMGLPIPAAGCVVATLVMTGIHPEGWWFPALILIVAYLMVSTVKYPDFKGKDGAKIHTVPVVITVALSVYLFYLFHSVNLFVPFFAYALFGILNTIYSIFALK
ncbi:CDP-diacylglycerol--serine O-phosphatidyltransferase [Acetonema longum]|uniref:CDP-diacylglycerol--serine O-phosphatidyltransferase n=1 Tax=Acetonema longum DSM 6540 TaxID=1009370 RepID=F7NPB8_9FIRM|nr:CDP-diacylglycerol--serine O-phosphatidyltransferase [Acetonema longum]EGO62080.1 CDP-diacylglycerol/serineO-phosphatidyl transferase [Acetonema longum DSM 6540]